ncbi:MAG: class I fructose-bisphosphate aldolase [Planctomycetota bacterium]
MSGKAIRMGRFLGEDRNVALVAVDHGAEFGPLPGLANLPETLVKLAGADGILINPGMINKCQSFFATPDAPAMIARLTWTTSYCFPWNYKEAHTTQVCSAAEALTAGADAVMACCTLLSGDEAVDNDNVALFTELAGQATEAGVPMIGEVYPLEAEQLPEDELHMRVLRGARMVAEFGADAVKTFYTGPRFAEVVESAGVPVFVLGASKTDEMGALNKAHEAVSAGARGVVFGRNVFQADDPVKFLAALAKVVHQEATPEEAYA